MANRNQGNLAAIYTFLTGDPRHYQIAVLASLLIYGVGWLSFDVSIEQIVILLGTVLLTQFICAQFPSSPW